MLVSFAKTSTEFRDEGFEERDADAIANGPNVTGEILTQVTKWRLMFLVNFVQLYTLVPCS